MQSRNLSLRLQKWAFETSKNFPTPDTPGFGSEGPDFGLRVQTVPTARPGRGLSFFFLSQCAAKSQKAKLYGHSKAKSHKHIEPGNTGKIPLEPSEREGPWFKGQHLGRGRSKRVLQCPPSSGNHSIRASEPRSHPALGPLTCPCGRPTCTSPG